MGVEALSGFDLSDVRVHHDSAAPARLGALALAQGRDIHVAPGQDATLPHEAWHVVQQLQGRVRPRMQLMRRGVSDDRALEREADAMGARAARLGARALGADPDVRRRPSWAAEAPIQRFPTKKKIADDKDPWWYDPKFPGLELIRLERDVYRIKGTEHTVHWRPPKYMTPTQGGRLVDFDMKAFMDNPEFLDFTDMYKDVSKAISSPTIDPNVKRALQLHVLQRFMVNALYSAEEIAKMNYQASPLNFQDSGNYIRSHATAFVEALKKFIGTSVGSDMKNVHLVRSTDFNDIMAQFLHRIDGKDLADDITAKCEQIAQYFIDKGRSLNKFEDYYGMLFADVTKALTPGKPMGELQTIVDDTAQKVNKRVFDTTFPIAVAKYVDKLLPAALEPDRAEVVKELITWIGDNKADLPKLLIQINARNQVKFDEDKRLKKAAVDDALSKAATATEAEAKKLFGSDIKPYREWLKNPGPGRALTTEETALTATTTPFPWDEFKVLYTSESFRAYAAAKKAKLDTTTYAPIDAKALLKIPELKEVKELKPKLEAGLPSITMVGGSIRLEEQAAFLLSSGTATDLVKMVEFGLNKAGYVPTPTAANRKMVAMGKTLQEIVLEVATEQRDHFAKTAETKAKLTSFIKEITDFDPDTYRSRIEAVQQLQRTKAAFARFSHLVTDSEAYVRLQAGALKKLIDGLRLLEPGSNIPAIALRELQVNLEDAIVNKADIAAFIRNIQNLHEALILALERDPILATGEKYEKLHIPEGSKGAQVTDYGLQAFARAYNAVLAQSGGKGLAIDAYSNIYFELLHKMGQVETQGGTTQLRKPQNLKEYEDLKREAKVEIKAPDLVLIDIHPNDASKPTMAKQQVIDLILAMFKDCKIDHRMTVIVDITLNHVSDPAVAEIKDATQTYIDSGQLNLVFIQSLTKFAEMGSDKQSGGLLFHYNDDKNWTEFNRSVADAGKLEPADSTAERYFRALLTYAEDEQKRYIAKIRENTKYVYQQLEKEFKRLGADPKTVELSVSDDPGACYVAFNYKDLAERLYAGTGGDRNVATEKLGADILNDAIYHLVNKLELPLSMRQSFGFPISNLGEAWIGSRFTIGTETHGKLDEYIRIITYVKAQLGKMKPELLKSETDRKKAFQELSNPIGNLNDLKRELDRLMTGK